MTRLIAPPSITRRRAASAPRMKPSRGFTLLELMIGALIGTMATLVVANVLLVAEGQRRAVTAGTDAQVNGSLSLYTIQRDVQMAGYGLTTSLGALGCEIKAQRNGVNFAFTLAPVTITDGAAGMPDTINVMGSATDRYSAPTRVVVDHPKQAANFFVNTTVGLAEGDLMLAVPAVPDANNWCSMFNITNLGGGGGGGGQGQGQNQVIHNDGSGGEWNQPGGQTIFPNAGYPAGSYLLNLGQFINRTYAINGGNALQVTTFSTVNAINTTQELYPGIVNLQAYYGLDTDADGVIDSYTATTPAGNANWRQLLAVRIAVVSRSTQFEKEDVTAANPVWNLGAAVNVAGSTACGASQCVTLKVDHLPDWKRYRYKIYDVVVPVRNMLWHS